MYIIIVFLEGSVTIDSFCFYSYGLGIYETKLPSSVPIWEHTGDIPGFITFTKGTLGGKHTLAVSLNSMCSANSPNPFKNIFIAESSR